MKSSEMLVVIRKLLDVWVDLQVGGYTGWAAEVFSMVNRCFTEFRKLLIAERKAMGGWD